MLSQSFINDLLKNSNGEKTTWKNNDDGSFSSDKGVTINTESVFNEIDPKEKVNKSKTNEGKEVKRKGNGENINYFDRYFDGSLYKIGNKERVKENTLKLFSHGSEYSLRGYQTIEDIEALLYKDSKMWRNFIDNGGTLTIQMVSCDGGDTSRDGSPIALELVKRHSGLTITAASDYVAPTADKKQYRIINNGVWNTYTNTNGTITTTSSTTRER